MVLTLSWLPLAAEGALRAMGSVSPRVGALIGPPGETPPQFFPDERLAYRPNPRFPGHDAAGFRNAAIPERARLVALGDSQTYGSGVRPEEAWPRVLTDLTGWPTYNMAFGGYGPTQSYMLLGSALERGPEVVVEAFYAGNDLFDCYETVYGRGQLEQWSSRDAERTAALRSAEEDERLEDKIARLFGETGGESPAVTWRGWLRRHSWLWGLLRAWKRQLGTAGVQEQWLRSVASAEQSGGREWAFASGASRTVFTPGYRAAALDRTDPRIAEGHRIALEALAAMHVDVERAGARFLVLLVPTKEYVFREEVARSGKTPPPVYSQLVHAEARMWEDTRSWLSERRIEFVDADLALRAALGRGEPLYPASRDGHPGVAGQRCLAAAVQERLAGEERE